MSGCACDGKAELRISDELVEEVPGGYERARLRCRKCGGKAGWIRVDAFESARIGREEIEESAAAGPPQWYLDVWKGETATDHGPDHDVSAEATEVSGPEDGSDT